MNFVKKGTISDFCEITHSKVPQPFNESSSMWFIHFSLCVHNWQTEAFTDMGFSEACQSLTLLLGDKHDKSRCRFMNWLLHFISPMFSVSLSTPFPNLPSSCPLPAFLLQLYIPLQIYSFGVKMNRKFLLACKSLYSPCQSLLTHLALELYDWLFCLFLYLTLCLSLFLSWVTFSLLLTQSSPGIRNTV